MENVDWIVISDTPSILYVNGVFCGEANACPKKISLAEKMIYIESKPLSQEFLPITSKSTFEHGQHNHARWFPLENGKRLLYLTHTALEKRRPLTAMAQVSHDDILHTLCDDGTCYLLTESSQHSVVIPLPYQLSSATLSEIDFIEHRALYLQAKLSCGQYFGIYTFDDRCTPQLEAVGSNCTIGGDTIILTQKPACHVPVTIERTWHMDIGTCKESNQHTVFFDSDKAKHLNNLCLCRTFLQLAKHKVQEAEFFLSPQLQANFNVQALHEFFGVIDVILPPLTNTAGEVFYLQESLGSTKLMKCIFSLEQSKIADMEIA